ncbi:mutS protein homolog 4-like [Uloborus diversus]|uniref:mutS protein homolog 4-like n=1 Tax=Uloborus diversus TaxID=327109 RepID=UPI00240975FD|nr:mutS protein homolog 4-like [Uloborus diversus]
MYELHVPHQGRKLNITGYKRKTIDQGQSSCDDSFFLQPKVPASGISFQHKVRISSVSTSNGTKTSKSTVTPNVPTSSTTGLSSYSKSSATPQIGSLKIAAVVEGRGNARGEIGMAYIDLRNPVLVLSQFADTQAYIHLAVQLNILQPIEVIMPGTVEFSTKSKLICRMQELFPDILTVTVLRKYFNETKGLQCIQELCAADYKTVEIEVAKKYYCLSACAALIKYVEYKQNMSYAHHSLRVIYCTSANTTLINTATACHLELVTNELGKIDHTLYGILNHTQTPGGNRLLRANILQPPCDLNTINTRLDCIAELISDEHLFYDLKAVIAKFVDTEQLLSLCVQIPKEKNLRNCEQKITNIICLKHALDLVKPLHSVLATSKNELFQTYFKALSDEQFLELQEKINVVIHSDTRWQRGVLNMHMQKCFAVKSNINGLLDVARRAYSESVNDIMEITKQLEKQYNIKLHVGFNSTRGFFLQIVSKLNIAEEDLPPVFVKVNKYKSTITCTTEDLIKLNDRVRESLQEIYLMSDIIIEEVLGEVREHVTCLYSLTEAVSSIDFLLSLAHVCTLSDHVSPEFSDTFAVKNGRHPVVEKIGGTTFIPNDTFFCEEKNFMILTGANMSGKTTYLKQIAILQIMAQMGSYVPAEFASFRLTDQILSRMGSNDDIEKNCSSLMVQMKEANYIVQQATDKSLIIIDELGRGTNIEEGCGLAYAICEALLETKAFTLCATHFSELVQLFSVYPNAQNYHFKVNYDINENDGYLCSFTYSLTQGPCKEKYYGIKMAEFSKIPSTVISDAKQLIDETSADDENAEKIDQNDSTKQDEINLAIHLIQVTQDSLLEEQQLRCHLKTLKSQICEQN